ncbi:MAG TPA: VOC family protein [Bauldia sp.]|nr:VOC family protein [Bauldia sp.]
MAAAKGKTKKKPPAKAPPKTSTASKTSVRAARPAAKPATKPAAARTTPQAASQPTPTPILPPTASKPLASSKPLGAGDFVLDKLHQVALTATNLDAAVEFYRDVLGLKFIARFDPPGLAFFQLSGGARLLLSTTSSSASLYFLVDDIDKAVQELKKRGVYFFHPPAMIHRDEAGFFGKKGNEEWMAFFKDPSGNLLGLVAKR